MEKRLVFEQIISDNKKLRNEEKHVIITKPYLLYFFKNRYVFYSLTSQTDRQNIYRIVAYICEECS